MSELYLTKVWGFEPKSYPAQGFNQPGARNNFSRQSKPGDWVVLVATMDEPTPVAKRGRFLGRVQLGIAEIDVEELLKSAGETIPEQHYSSQGVYKWKYGLPILEAELYVEQPLVKDVLGYNIEGTQWASFALNVGKHLGAEAVNLISNLKTIPIELAEIPTLKRIKAVRKSLSFNQTGNTGPGPSQERSGSQLEDVGAYAYLLKLFGTKQDIFKVGYTKSTVKRVAQLNKGLIPSVTEFFWECELKHRFSTAKEAYNFEQIMHSKLNNYLVQGEREVYKIPFNDIKKAWNGTIVSGDWAL